MVWVSIQTDRQTDRERERGGHYLANRSVENEESQEKKIFLRRIGLRIVKMTMIRTSNVPRQILRFSSLPCLYLKDFTSHRDLGTNIGLYKEKRVALENRENCGYRAMH
jgi:hypothetical protein